VLLCWYLLGGIGLAAVCDVVFVKDGCNSCAFPRRSLRSSRPHGRITSSAPIVAGLDKLTQRNKVRTNPRRARDRRARGLISTPAWSDSLAALALNFGGIGRATSQRARVSLTVAWSFGSLNAPSKASRSAGTNVALSGAQNKGRPLAILSFQQQLGRARTSLTNGDDVPNRNDGLGPIHNDDLDHRDGPSRALG